MNPSKRSASRICLSIPGVSGKEMEYIREAFESNWLSSSGPNLTALEQMCSQKFGIPSVALNSGTAALHLALKLVGVQSGDEVLMPTLTFAACCHAIRYENARPVLIDSETTSWGMDPNLLAEFLERRAKKNRLPKAVCVVHLFGQAADLDAICNICSHYGVPLIEDAAHALGTLYRGKQVGTLGSVGLFSLGGNKIITATCGGILVSPKKEWVEKAKYWSMQSRETDPDGINNYVHNEVGYNYRMSNVLAGIALGQFDVLEERIKQRRAVFQRYEDAFKEIPGIEPQPEASWGRHTRWLSCFVIDENQFGIGAADLIRLLDDGNIESRPVWKPMHTQPAYKQFECIGGGVAEDLNQRGICLPSSSNLREEDQEFVIDTVREAFVRAKQDRAMLTDVLEL